MKKNSFSIETKYIVAIIISLILGASILGYGYLNYKYKKEALEQKIKSEEQIKAKEEKLNTTRQAQLQNCLDDVTNRFRKATEETKTITNEGAKIIIDAYQKQKDDCFKQYPQQ